MHKHAHVSFLWGKKQLLDLKICHFYSTSKIPFQHCFILHHKRELETSVDQVYDGREVVFYIDFIYFYDRTF